MDNYPILEAIDICIDLLIKSRQLKPVEKLNEEKNLKLHVQKILLAKNEMQIGWQQKVPIKLQDQNRLERFKVNVLNLRQIKNYLTWNCMEKVNIL